MCSAAMSGAAGDTVRCTLHSSAERHSAVLRYSAPPPCWGQDSRPSIRSAVRCSAMTVQCRQYSAMQCNGGAVQGSTVQCNTLRCSAFQVGRRRVSSPVRGRTAVQCSPPPGCGRGRAVRAVQCSTVQCRAAVAVLFTRTTRAQHLQCGAVQCSAVQYSAQHSRGSAVQWQGGAVQWWRRCGAMQQRRCAVGQCSAVRCIAVRGGSDGAAAVQQL